MKFKAGNVSDAIVSDEPIDDWHRVVMGDDDQINYYGGYVICKSVHPKVKPLLLAAPELYNICVYGHQVLVELLDAIKEGKPITDEDISITADAMNAMDKLIKQVYRDWSETLEQRPS